MKIFDIRNTIKEFEEVEDEYVCWVRERMRHLIAMDVFIRLKTNEEGILFFTWVMSMPNEASIKDYEDLAREDEGYFELCELFSRLILLDVK